MPLRVENKVNNMKLITEYLPDTTEIVTEGEGADKKLYIEGVFMQAAKKNRNGRIYPTEILEGAVQQYIDESVSTNSAIGELNHPASPIPNPREASHRIVELRKEGNDFYGKALVLNTPMGNTVKGLIEGGVRLGVSSRGLGTVKEVDGVNEVQKDFVLKTVDIVHNPSAPDAYVNGIMEGVDYLVDGSTIDQNLADKHEQVIKNTPAELLPEVKLRLFREAMSSIAVQSELREQGINELEMFKKGWLKGMQKDPAKSKAEISELLEVLKKAAQKASPMMKPAYKEQIAMWNRALASISAE